MLFHARHRTIAFPRRPLLIGIVNLNDDSFCHDGTLDPQRAIAHAVNLARDGADIIDVGAESARTNRPAIDPQTEISRLEPFFETIASALDLATPRDADQVWPPLISLNTWRPQVVAELLPRGVDILNDIGGLVEPTNAQLCAKNGTALLIMHTVGQPKIPHIEEQYKDIWKTLFEFFDARIAVSTAAGLTPDRLILDPGIDFAKQEADNLRILRHLDRLTAHYASPVLLPISRKTVIGDVLDLPEPNDRDAGSIACLVAGLRRGAHIFRVHNVRGMFEALKVIFRVEQPHE